MGDTPSSRPALTDAGRAYVRRMRLIFLPVRVGLVLALLTAPIGGPLEAWAVEGLRPFLVAFVLMIALERAGITADFSARSQDGASKFALVAAMFAALMLGVHQAARGDVLPWPWRLLGFVTWGAGEGVRQWAMATLGRFFTDQVRIFNDHQLILEGPYRLVRHPSYAGLSLVMIGAPLATGSWLAVVVSMIMGGVALGYRIRVEERALTAAFGEAYERYRARTPALLPWPRPAARA